ncbi:MAG TPA: hypothetical protein VEL76_17510 [Gemmataceae bacterium]|nr:hypothetical protein [Gemmataceae bacterium]
MSHTRSTGSPLPCPYSRVSFTPSRTFHSYPFFFAALATSVASLLEEAENPPADAGEVEEPTLPPGRKKKESKQKPAES